MMKFDSNAILVDNRTGQRHYIYSYNASVSPNQGFREEYILVNVIDGVKTQIVGTDINYYYDEAKHPACPATLKNEDLMDALKYVLFDDTHIKLHKNLISKKECDHEWVTWTGLRGEVTDCTKCKAVK